MRVPCFLRPLKAVLSAACGIVAQRIGKRGKLGGKFGAGRCLGHLAFKAQRERDTFKRSLVSTFQAHCGVDKLVEQDGEDRDGFGL
jgi:hypothetical protein